MERKDANFFSAQIRLWAGIFNYKGTSTRKEYWFAFLFHAILGILAFFGILLSSGIFLLQEFVDESILLNIIHFILLIPAVLIIIYLVLSIIPWIALTVRRLRDAGKSGWWTILLLFVGIGHIILLILCALGSAVAGVAFFTANNIQPSVYGPPEWYDPSYNQNDDVYGPPGPDIFNPDDNETPNVYGPPEWFDDDDDFDPNINITEPMYGPPPFDEDDYDPNVNQNEDVYGPPDWFDNPEEYDPEINLNEDVYGPPEWFEENENDFDFEKNMEPTVYGPPDWFE